MRVLLTGGSGAVGSSLIPQLVEHGHEVTATTRRPERLERLRLLGADAIVLDGLDGPAVGEAVALAEPDAIVHEMTALAGQANLRHFDRWFAATNELRTTGTDHLLAAARATGVKRFIAQSYTGWNNIRQGGPVKTEMDPLDPNPAAEQRETMAAIQYVERVVPAAPFTGIVLRYGNLYGPGASDAMIEMVRKRMMPVIGGGTGVWSWLHIDDAARSVVAALERGESGVYNIVDDEPATVSEWLPCFAAAIGAKPPLRIPAWLGRILAGDLVVQWMTQSRGSSNAKARAELGWHPIWRTWRDGFRDGLTATNRASRPPRRTVAA